MLGVEFFRFEGDEFYTTLARSQAITTAVREYNEIVVTNVDPLGQGGLQEALDIASGTSFADALITFDPSLNGATIVVEDTLFHTTKRKNDQQGTIVDGDIDGDGRADITLSGDVRQLLLNNTSSGEISLELKNIDIAIVESEMAVIENRGLLTLSNVGFENVSSMERALISQQGISRDASVTLQDVLFDDITISGGEPSGLIFANGPNAQVNVERVGVLQTDVVASQDGALLVAAINGASGNIGVVAVDDASTFASEPPADLTNPVFASDRTLPGIQITGDNDDNTLGVVRGTEGVALLGFDGADRLYGSSQNDILAPGLGADRVFGGGGDDTAYLLGALADYNVGGRRGFPLYDGERSANLITLTRGGEENRFFEVETFVFADQTVEVEDLLPPLEPDSVDPVDPGADGSGGDDGGNCQDVGTPNPGGGEDSVGPTNGDDMLTGTTGPDRISALLGNDTVTGLGGSDTLSGDGGADVIIGNGGRDFLSGGGGKDSIVGGGGKDSISGNGGRDTLEGSGGRDTIDGGGGRDALSGGGGKDLLTGGGGKDELDGGGGKDTLVGGRGRDELTGGAGRDTFKFERGDGRDTITDFRQGQDRIVVNDREDLLAALDSVQQRGENVFISFANVKITVLDSDADAFTAADFIF